MTSQLWHYFEALLARKSWLLQKLVWLNQIFKNFSRTWDDTVKVEKEKYWLQEESRGINRRRCSDALSRATMVREIFEERRISSNK